MMGHIFQAEWWGKHPSGCLFRLLWLRKLEKEMAKAIKRQNEIFGMIIYENNGNEEKRKVKGHRLHVRRKIIKNKENRGLIHKNASEDHLESFFF